MKAQLLCNEALPQMTEHKEKIAEGLWWKVEDPQNHDECYLCKRPIRFQDAEGNQIKHYRVRGYLGSMLMSIETSDMIGESYNGIEAEIVDKKGNVISETTLDEGGEGGTWAVGSCCAKKLGEKWVRCVDPENNQKFQQPVEEPAEAVVEEVVAQPKKENSRKKYSVRLTKKQIEVLMDRMQIEIYNHDPSCPVSSEPNIDKIFLAILNNADKAIGGGGGYDLKFFN